MLSRADILGTRPAAIIEAPTPVEATANTRQEITNRLTQIAIGRQLQAEVLTHLADGTFLVRVADTTARMNLPQGTQIGDSIRMTMLANAPRPTFLLAAQPENATAVVSSTGRLINELLQSADEQGAPVTVNGSKPLAASRTDLSKPEFVPQVAAALHDAMSVRSGLFYESHVQEWVNGSRTLAELMREPQARAGTAPSLTQSLPVNGTTVENPQTTRSQLVAHLREWAGGERSLIDLLRSVPADVTTALSTDADTIIAATKGTTGNVTLNPETAQIIHLQLNTLEQKQVLWQGELFPGQRMEWEVSEDAPQRDVEAPESSWRSAVRFELPTLGTVSASIHLQGDRVHVQIRTASDEAMALLRSHSTEFANALEAAGSPLNSLQINQDEKT